MKTKLFKVLSIVIILSMMLPLTAFGQTVADTPPTGGFPEGLDLSDLRMTEDQPQITAEFSGAGKGLSRYIVILGDPSVATYMGGISSLAATSPAVTGAVKLDASAPASVAYAAYLKEQQNGLLDSFAVQAGRSVEVIHHYAFALNGFAVKLNKAEAALMSQMPGVASVELDTAFKPTTDTSPDWLGASKIWDGSNTGGLPGTMGEGIVVGVLDTGINMDHPSFAEVGGDGYQHVNPFGSGYYLGWCNPLNPDYDPAYKCNDKLIGAWDYADASWGETGGPEDTNGHGSHTASTAAGNIVTAAMYAPTVVHTDTVSGMAPHANIIMYDVCGPSCYTTDVVAGINQALIDGVDVLNESIGIGGDTFLGSKQQAYLSAVAAGIFPARSAGNDGPGASTTGPEPVWTLSTANMSHSRAFVNAVVDMAGGANPPADIQGVGLTDGYGPATIVYAGDYPSTLTANPNLCGVGAIEDYVSPWPPGTFNGEIVVCDRGTFGRVEKGANVLAAGAGGYILADNGSGLVADPHELPGVHISYDDGQTLIAWLSPTTTQTATIAGYTLDRSAENGDILAGGSSRGPIDVNVIKPDAGAPGTAVWAAYMDNPGGQDEGAEFTLLGGTSMASPHIAGIGALLKSLHPDWTPAQIKAAIMTTATTANTVKEDGVTPTDPFDVGGGRVQADWASQAGLLFDVTVGEYFNAAPALGGKPEELNIPSFANMDCYQECSWERTATNPTGVAETWTAVVDGPVGLEVTVDPPTFTIAAGGEQTFKVTADVTGALPDEWAHGSVTWVPTGGSAPAASLPLSVFASSSTDLTTVSKTVDASSASQGDEVEYEIMVNNLDVVSKTFTLTDVIPANAEYISGTATGGLVYDETSDSLTWSGDFGPAGIAIEPFVGYGYLPLSNFGIAPFDFPSDPDDGCWGMSGFDFYYLGDHYSTAIWSTNGTLEAGQASGSCASASNTMLPNPNAPNNLLAPWWSDINFNDGGEWYIGGLAAGPNTFTVIEWKAAPEWTSDGSATNTASFQIWILDGTDMIWYAYDTISAGWMYATIGAEDGSGALGDTVYYDGAGTKPSPTDELIVLYMAPTPAELGYKVKATGIAGDGILNEVMVVDQDDNMFTSFAYTKLFGDIYFPFINK